MSLLAIIFCCPFYDTQKGRLAFHLYHQDRCSVAQQNLCLCCHAVTNEADTMLYISGGYKSLEPAPLVVKKKKKKIWSRESFGSCDLRLNSRPRPPPHFPSDRPRRTQEALVARSSPPYRAKTAAFGPQGIRQGSWRNVPFCFLCLDWNWSPGNSVTVP